MKTIKQRLNQLEQRIPCAYPKGWPVLVPDEYTDLQIETLKAEIKRTDIYRESDQTWAEMFLG